MSIYRADMQDIDSVAPLIAKFRVELKSYKNTQADEDISAAKNEFAEYIDEGFPVFVYKDGSQCLGFLVCRVNSGVVWVESLYVLNEHRRKGIAALLFSEAEKLAASYGGDMVYNYVHPNNDGMISFLNKRGYNVLNLIEIRKKYENEEISEQIRIRNNLFEY